MRKVGGVRFLRAPVHHFSLRVEGSRRQVDTRGPTSPAKGYPIDLETCSPFSFLPPSRPPRSPSAASGSTAGGGSDGNEKLGRCRDLASFGTPSPPVHLRASRADFFVTTIYLSHADTYVRGVCKTRGRISTPSTVEYAKKVPSGLRQETPYRRELSYLNYLFSIVQFLADVFNIP